ncbi:MAG: hypothetical protein V3V00_13935 [Saprospiraceae bacterium]
MKNEQIIIPETAEYKGVTLMLEDYNGIKDTLIELFLLKSNLTLGQMISQAESKLVQQLESSALSRIN